VLNRRLPREPLCEWFIQNFKIMRIHAAAVISAVASLFSLGLAPKSSGQIPFHDDFDSGFSGGAWTTNQSGGDSFVDYAFDYATLGIPASPNSLGTTFGMRFLVNQSAGVFQGISASPTGKSFTGDFTIRFDAWLNALGPFPLGGSGSTQMASFGWGTSGSAVQWAASKHSVFFAASGEGGTTQDYRAYLNFLDSTGAPISPTNPANVYAAGTTTTPDSRNNSDPYYASLGGESAPGAQLLLYPDQSGITAVGTFGMAWRDVRIEKLGDNVSWYVDDLRIATVPITGATLGGENIFFGMFDINGTSSTDPNDFLNAAIFDNIRVEAIPEPASAALLGGATVALALRRRRR
jgi:hypothetical protein